MAIEQITFVNDAVTGYNTSGINSAVINGSIQVDYNNNPATVTGALTLTDANGSENFGPFSIIHDQQNDTYLVSGFGQADNVHDSLTFIYQGQAPASATDISATKGGNNYSTTANDPVISTPVCFVTGTRIRTARGEIAVEDLVAGDLVVTASGAQRPIKWIGHRTVDTRLDPRTHEVMPIRISAHAFGCRRPVRDLFLSAGHPILVGATDDGVGDCLVPIMCLINGTSIERVGVDKVTYWHVELDAHDILLAEGLPAESYLDWGDRSFFTEGADHALANPDFVVPGLPSRCRPVAIDGPIVEEERRRLDAVLATRLTTVCEWPGEPADSWLVDTAP